MGAPSTHSTSSIAGILRGDLEAARAGGSQLLYPGASSTFQLQGPAVCSRCMSHLAPWLKAVRKKVEEQTSAECATTDANPTRRSSTPPRHPLTFAAPIGHPSA